MTDFRSDFDEFADRDCEAREFEARLSQQMQRVAAPAGFADRVMTRVAMQRPGGGLLLMPRRSVWIAIAAMLLIGIGAGIAGLQWKQRQLRRDRQEAELVQHQFDLAMQVTQRTLAEVQERVGRAGEIHGGDLQIQRRAASSRDRSQREVHP